MNATDLLLAHFDTSAEAPGGVARLRRLILQLAVQGRLVPQDPSDEPASKQIDMVRSEFDISSIQRKVRGARPEREIRAEEMSHEVPIGWALLTVENACTHIIDCLHTTPIFTQEGHYCIDTNCISPGKIHFDKARFVSKNTFIERTRRLLPVAGDVLVSSQ